MFENLNETGVAEQLKTYIDRYGVEFTSKYFMGKMNDMVDSKEVALQFVLEELDAARQGSEIARSFVDTSGISPDDFIGAMDESYEEIDGSDGPQVYLLNICMLLVPDREMMTKLRLEIVNNIMKKWSLGKYAVSPFIDDEEMKK